MRKDLQIGMAIGGVLLLVLIVYMMIPANKGGAKGGGTQQVVQTNQANDASNSGLGGSASDATLTGGTSNGASPSKEKEPVKSDGTGVAAADGATLPGGVNMDEPHDITTVNEGPATTASGGAGAEKDWNALLNDASPLLTKTPSPATTGGSSTTSERSSAEKRQQQSSAESADPSVASHTSTTLVDPFGSGPETKKSNGSSTGAGSSSTAPAGARTHQIRENETYSSIAKSIYGAEKYASVIQKANPGLDPRRLKVGMTITLPDPASVKSTVAAASPKNTPPSLSATVEKPIDSATEYRVQSGDTLERIARKRYGSPMMKEEIYRLNEKTIGPDENRLKLNMVLKMPPNPSSAVPAAAHTSAR